MGLTNSRVRIVILAVGVLALLGVWGFFAVASGSNAFADEPDEDPPERVKAMIAEHRSINHVKFSANDKVSVPDDPKGSVLYRLESYDYDEEDEERSGRLQRSVQLALLCRWPTTKNLSTSLTMETAPFIREVRTTWP